MKKRLGDCTLDELNHVCTKYGCYRDCPLKQSIGYGCALDELLQYRRDKEIDIPE